MFKSLLFAILVSICFFSCEADSIVRYSYKNVTIWRIDEPGKTIFYYNKIGKEMPQIWSEYSGINDGFKGFLLFEDNGRVMILSGDGYFQAKNLDYMRFNFKEITYDIPKLGENVYFIQDAVHYEQIHNKGSGTKINVIYPRNK